MKVWHILPILLLSACSTSAHKPTKISLAEANSPSAYKEYSFVKVCGYATNTPENSQILTTRKDNNTVESVGLGVKWLDAADEITIPEKRCVRGFLTPTCGWGDPPDDKADFDIDNYKPPVCANASTAYQWSIRQEFLADD